MKRQIRECFVRLAAILWFITSLASLYGASGPTKINHLVLNQMDPAVPLTNRHVLLIFGILQLLLSAYLLIGQNLLVKLVLTICLAFMLLCHRVDLWWSGHTNICEYLGGVPEQLLISPEKYRMLIVAIPLSLLLGSLVLLCRLHFWQECTVRISELKRPASRLKSESPNLLSLLCGWGIGSALIGLLLAGVFFRIWAALPPNFHLMAKEIASVGEFRRAPIVNRGGTELAYLRNGETNVGSFKANVVTREQSQPQFPSVRSTPSIYWYGLFGSAPSYGLFGWSPDDRYLVYSWTRTPARTNRQVALCDGATGALLKTFEAPESVRQVLWFTTNSMVWIDNSYTLYAYNLGTATNLGRFGTRGMVQVRKFHKVPGYYEDGTFSLVLMSNHEIGYTDQGNVWTFDIAANRARKLSDLTTNVVLEWLDYCPANGQFLFSLTDRQTSQVRRLYVFDPKAPSEHNLTLCSPHNRVFKGQWILGGAGISYVDTISNKNCLTVKTEDRTFQTDLFLDGHVRSYCVAPNKQSLFAFASPDDGPMGIWEYDIISHKLCDVVAAIKKPLVIGHITTPVKTSINGLGYFFLPPAGLDKNKKYPLLFDSTRDSRWDSGAEILANAGIYYVSVNLDGMSSFYNFSTSPHDMLEVYQAMLKNPNIDPHRIYLAGISAGTRGVADLVDRDASKWRGAALMSPVSFPDIPNSTKEFPSLFISIPELDENRRAAERFAEEAASRRIPVTVVYHPGQQHILESNESIRDRYEALAKFILLNR